jgi:hypothetical protein
MYAPLLACLLLTSGFVAGSEPGSVLPGSILEVYLKAAGSSSSSALEEMKVEVVSLMQTAGVGVEWRKSNEETPFSRGDLVVVTLNGICQAPPRNLQIERLKSLPPLAASSVVDGRILPFVSMNCNALSHFVGPLLSDHSSVQRDFVYGRAMARLLAHELYHVLVQTRDHTETGIAESQVSSGELLAEHFGFGEIALTRLARRTMIGSSAMSVRQGSGMPRAKANNALR